MPEVRSLTEEARGALLSGNPRRALEVCEHVLARYPKHLEAYCLSAEALRELGELSTARDRFLRVLSADPENVIAYWGLSIISEEESRLDAAAWGVDRAFAVNPGHRELAHEFARLTGEQPLLSRAGLARVRLRNGYYELAIREAKAALEDEPDRLDLRLLHAEAQWRCGHLDDAERSCRDVLDDSPDCLKAALILGDCLIRSAHGAQEEANRLLRRTLALDPEARMAIELFGQDALPEAIRDGLADLSGAASDVELASPSFSPSPNGILPDWRHEPPSKAVEGLDKGLQMDLDSGSTVADEIIASGLEVGSSSSNGVPPAQPDPPVAPWLAREAEKPKQPVGRRDPDMATLATGATDAIDPLQDPRWADLLTLDAGLDPENEARLNAALLEMGFSAPETTSPSPSPVPTSSNDEGWREVFTGHSGLVAALDTEEPKDSVDHGLDTESHPQVEEHDYPVRSHPGDTSEPLTASIANGSSPSSQLDEPPAGLSEVEQVPGGVRNVRQEAQGGQPSSPKPSSAEPSPDEPTEGHADEDAVQAPLEVAHAFQRAGNLDAAVAEYARLIRVAPEHLDDIVEQLKWLIYSTPEHAAAHRALGDAYMRLGRFQEAIDQYNWVMSQRRGSAAGASASGAADA